MASPLSDVAICNLALGRVGVAETISSLSDQTPAGYLCANLYPQMRDSVLTDFPWPFASAYLQLAQVSPQGVRANVEWAVSYRYPSDCIFVRRLVCTASLAGGGGIPQTSNQTLGSFSEPWRREDGDGYPWPWEVGSDTVGLLIYSDLLNATCKYTRGITNSLFFSLPFCSALAWRLAMELAMPLARSLEFYKLAESKYKTEIETARSLTKNESQDDGPLVQYNAEAVRARQVG